MPTAQELEARFWKSLKSDMTMMIGLDGVEDGHARPMTAQLEGDRGPIWFSPLRATASCRSSAGTTAPSPPSPRRGTTSSPPFDNDRAVIDKLWNRWIAAWYEGGKDDPKLALLRLDPERAEIWLDASSIIAGIKIMLGADPKQDYKDKVAEVRLR